jgi:hypothetical protein
MFGREEGHGREPYRVCVEQRVSDVKRRRVDQADYVSAPSLIGHLPFAAEHLLRVLRREGASRTGMGDDHAPMEDTGADPDEGDMVTMRRIHS